MFATYYEGGHFHSIDHFEEYLSILRDLSFREFQVLAILYKHERANPLNERNALQRTAAIWSSFETEVQQQLAVDPATLRAVLTRIQRTGRATKRLQVTIGTTPAAKGNSALSLSTLFAPLKSPCPWAMQHPMR